MIGLRALFLAFCLAACLCDATIFRWASIPLHSSADPHAQNQIVNNAINGQVYEALVKRGKKLETDLDCQNVREPICTAVAGMLARVNVKVKVNSLANARYFSQGQARAFSLCLPGWGGPNNDAIFTLQPLLQSRNARGDGDFNWGDYRDEKRDALIDQAKIEMDPANRQVLINDSFRIERENVHHIPLHRRMAPWASRANVEVAYRPDSWIEVRWVSVK